jgi:hypothetical protein
VYDVIGLCFLILQNISASDPVPSVAKWLSVKLRTLFDLSTLFCDKFVKSGELQF